jgi:hypothetical protein
MLRRVLLAIALSTALPALAQSDVTPSANTSKFVMGTRLGYITCSDKYRAYLEKWELYALVNEGQKEPRGSAPSDAEVADCIHQTALRGSALYKDALKGAASPKARAAFGEYYTAWDAALKGIRRNERETPQQYRTRQKQTEDRLNALQGKLETATPS